VDTLGRVLGFVCPGTAFLGQPRGEFLCHVLRERLGREAVLLRGQLLPLVRLRELLRAAAPTVASRALPVIVLELGERRTGVVVDALVGQQEIVVKTFEAPRGTLPVFSGATILGDGVPALILDAGGLV